MLRIIQLSCLCMGFLMVFVPRMHAQTYLKGSYVRSEIKLDGNETRVYTFSRKKGSRGTIKAKYFAQNAYHEFEKWKGDKHILFYCSGAFSLTWDPGSPPHGICVDNGQIVNRAIDPNMDGLVIVYNGGRQAGGIAVIDIEKDSIEVNQGGKHKYYLPNLIHRTRFLQWAEAQSATVFQTQLMYTKSHGYGFPSHQLNYGKNAARRFLAICMKKGVVYHIVVDHPESDYLNHSAQNIAKYLKDDLGYTLYGLFNLDTGGKDIMYAYDENENLLDTAKESLNKATNLLVYYVD